MRDWFYAHGVPHGEATDFLLLVAMRLVGLVCVEAAMQLDDLDYVGWGASRKLMFCFRVPDSAAERGSSDCLKTTHAAVIRLLPSQLTKAMGKYTLSDHESALCLYRQCEERCDSGSRYLC